MCLTAGQAAIQCILPGFSQTFEQPLFHRTLTITKPRSAKSQVKLKYPQSESITGWYQHLSGWSVNKLCSVAHLLINTICTFYKVSALCDQLKHKEISINCLLMISWFHDLWFQQFLWFFKNKTCELLAQSQFHQVRCMHTCICQVSYWLISSCYYSHHQRTSELSSVYLAGSLVLQEMGTAKKVKQYVLSNTKTLKPRNLNISFSKSWCHTKKWFNRTYW